MAISGEPTIIKEEKAFGNAIYNYTFMQNFYLKNKENLDYSVCDIYGDEPTTKLEYFFKKSNDEVMADEKTFGW